VGRLGADHDIAERIELECGVGVPWIGSGRNWKKFFRESELRDLLDSFTHVYAILALRQRSGYHSVAPLEWQKFVVRVLAEEHVSYVVDEFCNVRYGVDEQFVVSRGATLAGLQGEEWAAARGEFERAFAAIDAQPPDTNGAIRAIAAAVESCAKVISGPSMSRLGAPEIQKYLRPRVEELHADDSIASNAATLLLKSLSEWVNATHQYRHGQQSGVEVKAPLALTVQFLTTGSGFLRWLINVGTKSAQPRGSA
jgi:hypothetical protein